MPNFAIRLIVGGMLLLGGSAVLGQMPNQLIPPYQHKDPGSRPGPVSRALATAAGPWDNAFTDLEVRDTLVYCGMLDGLMILNISDSSEPELVSRIYFEGELTSELKLLGDSVYMSAYATSFETSTFRIVDVSDPTLPFSVGTYPIASAASGLDVVDSLVFVVMSESIGGFNAMFILNIVDPDSIVLLDSIPTNYWLDNVRVRGDYAYAVGGDLCTIDISDPSEAIVVSQFSPDISHQPINLDLKEDDSLLYIADLSGLLPAYWSAFSVYNVADPANPSLWGRYPLIAFVADVKVKGDFAYVSNGSCGLQVFDISDPTAPDSVGRYLAPSDWVNYIQSFAGPIAIQNDLLLLADNGPYTNGAEAYWCDPTILEPGDPSPGDLIILDISEPTEPTLLGHYTPSDPTDVDDDDHADELPGTFALHQNYPNPFNPTTNIRFSLPRRSEIVLTVYNLLGQEVSRLVQTMSAGNHTIELDMKDQSSGVYFYELQATDFSETKKMLLLK